MMYLRIIILAFLLLISPSIVQADDLPNQLTASLQYHLTDGRITFKNGIYEINDTLETPIGTGIQILGRGIDSKPKDSDRPNEARLSTGQATRIRYIGPPGKPMIRLRGSEAIINGITLDCNGLASCGVLLDKSGVEGIYAPGKLYDSSFRVEGATEAAITCGTIPDSNHCDEVTIDYLQVDSCARILLSRNHMSMVHHFKHVDCYSTPIGFEYQGGGVLLVDHMTMLHKGTILVINEKKKTNGTSTIGSGNWIYRVNNLKCDAQNLGEIRLVEKLTETMFHATFDSGVLPKGSKELVKAKGSCVVTINNYSGLNPNCLNVGLDWRGKHKPNIAINRSNFMLSAKSLEDLLIDGASCHLNGVQNFDYYGQPIGN